VASNGSKLIGISSYQERVRFSVWDVPAVLLPKTYVDGVLAAGGVPVLLPPVGSWDIGILSRLDGLVLAGGADIDPVRYGEEPLSSTGTPRVDRDAAEFEMLDAALKAGIPVLGVCRGLQLLNIALGGNLRQHLPSDLGNTDHLPMPGTFGRVEVKVAAGSRLAEIIGQEITVPCHHHQGVDRLGQGLVPVAWAPDGSVEAVEQSGDRFVVGVQWHPEEDGADVRLFQALVASA
jgi:putative glutamine amidotransferase